MKITKYAESCIIVESRGTRILVDPGTVHYQDTLLETEWTNIDVILVTHKHPDHCNVEAICAIIERDDCLFYSSSEVLDTYAFRNSHQVTANDHISIGSIDIEVTQAFHGYLTGMHENNREIKENIGFIIDDEMIRLYITSDTINFYNQYQCDVICMPFNGNGLTVGIVDGIDFLNHTGAQLVLPVHDQPPREDMKPDFEQLEVVLQKQKISYRILKEKETIVLRKNGQLISVINDR